MIKFSEEVADALENKKPVVALESTVIAHGLPFPQNVETARKMENIVRANGASPATIAVFEGEFRVGLNENQIYRLATNEDIRKISRRDLPVAVGKKLNAATTVAATSYIAYKAGIEVFATGGIGGVHCGRLPDVSADLPELAQTPITIVCSGAKIVLDLPATREWLETYGICVLGYRCDEMPAFYSRKSDLTVDERIETPEEAARIIKARDRLNLKSAILITVPVPEEYEIEAEELKKILRDALETAEKQSIKGKEITPFLLARMSERSAGKTLAANIALLENNAAFAARIAAALTVNKKEG